MPSGDAAVRLIRAGARCARPRVVHARSQFRILAMNPMPSGEGAGEAAQAAGGVGGAPAQADQLAGAIAVFQAGGATARQAFGRARAGAEPAMHAAAAMAGWRQPQPARVRAPQRGACR